MTYKIEYTKKSQSDYDNLDNSQKIQIQKSLSKVESHGMDAGQPLYGKLSGCNKLKHKKLGLRVIFRRSSKGIEIVEIVVIGARGDNEVYDIAIERLGRA